MLPGTAKFRDLVADPRYTLHTATVDTHVTDGDAKVWGTGDDVHDEALHRCLADALSEETGLDLRGSGFEHVFGAGVSGAAAVRVADGHLDIVERREGRPERVVRKY